MKANYKIKLNESNIQKLEEAKIQALKQLIPLLSTEVESAQVVPFAEGTLKDSVSYGVENMKGYISWNTPYARRLYFHPEFNFRQDMHVNACGLWMDYWVKGDGKNWVKSAYSKLLKECSKGVLK